MNLLDPYEPPFKPKKSFHYPCPYGNEYCPKCGNMQKLEELDRPPVTEYYEDSPFADRKPIEKLADKWDKEVEEARKGKSFTSGKEMIDDILE